MTVFVILVAFFLALLGALIAWLGDVLGYRLGKSRRSLFGLRPRSTARLIGVIVGALLPLLGLGVAAVGSEQVRIALFHLDELLTRNKQLSVENKGLVAEQGKLRAKVNELIAQTAQSEKEARSAEADASRSRQAAAAATRSLSSAQATLRAAEARLRPLQTQRDTLKRQVDQLNRQAQVLNDRLSNARTEIARVQSQREAVQKQLDDTAAKLKETAEESSRVRAERDKLQGQLANLQNQLADLDRERKRLQGETDRAQRDLDTTREELEARKTDLVKADEKYAEKLAEFDVLREKFRIALQEQRIIEETPVIMNAGDEIVRARVSGRQREDQLRAALEELLVLANNASVRRGIAPEPDGRSVLLVRPLPPRAPLDRLPSENDIIDGVAMRIRQANEDYFIVIFRALERHFAGERRALRVESWFTPDKVRFRKGEVLYSLNFRPKTPTDEVLRTILDVRGHLRDIARARGLVPDPSSGEYGGLSADQVLLALRKIADSRRPVQVDLVVADDIKTAQPLALTLEVKPAREQPGS
jgi:uncharacterized protein (DUF3084 family)